MRTYVVQRTADEALNRNLITIADAIADTQAAIATGMAGGVLSIYSNTKTAGAELVAICRGDIAATLTLPRAAVLGVDGARIYVAVNDSSQAWTIAVQAGDSLTGSATLASPGQAVFVSDGVTKWFRVVS